MTRHWSQRGRRDCRSWSRDTFILYLLISPSLVSFCQKSTECCPVPVGQLRGGSGYLTVLKLKTFHKRMLPDIKRSWPSSKYQILRSLWNLVRSSHLKAAVFWCCRYSLHPHTHVKYFPTLKYNYLTFTRSPFPLFILPKKYHNLHKKVVNFPL